MPTNDPVKFDLDEGWGFWDEAWSYFYGGYDSEQSARIGLTRYARMLQGDSTATAAFYATLPVQNKDYAQN